MKTDKITFTPLSLIEANDLCREIQALRAEHAQKILRVLFRWMAKGFRCMGRTLVQRIE